MADCVLAPYLCHLVAERALLKQNDVLEIHQLLMALLF